MKSISQENYLERLARGKKWGVYVGIVTDNKDPDGNYRVKVRIPAFDNGDTSGESSFWYRCCTFGAGKDRGMFNLPEVSDEVLVAFENGEVSHGYVVGTCWNSSSTAIGDNKDGKNDFRWYKSRSGHMFKMCDGDKTSMLQQTPGGHQISVDDDSKGQKGQGSITIKHSSGDATITLTNDTIKLEAKTLIHLTSKDEIRFEAKQINGSSKQQTEFKAGTNFVAKATADVDISAQGQGSVTSNGVMTIKGSIVNIN